MAARNTAGAYVGLITGRSPNRYWTLRKKEKLIASGFCLNRELAKAAIEQIIAESLKSEPRDVDDCD